ncbi:PTS transporter subunit EIIB [Curtobacterium flaccumfaciens]|nr:PTS transporter subunit EIIB [Curtobacterium flaccumfaciens]
MPDAQQLAQQILDAVGGSTNIADVENCMTRLRVEVVSDSSVALEDLKATDGVMAAIAAGSNLQIVLGPGLVDRVAVDLEALRTSAPPAAAGGPGASGASPDELAARGASIKASARARSDGRTMRAIRRISAIFIPLIPALIACGLIAGINGILTNLGWLPGVTPFLGVLSSGFLSLLAVFVGMNAAKEFGGTPILGGAVRCDRRRGWGRQRDRVRADARSRAGWCAGCDGRRHPRRVGRARHAPAHPGRHRAHRRADRHGARRRVDHPRHPDVRRRRRLRRDRDCCHVAPRQRWGVRRVHPRRVLPCRSS